MWSDSRTAAFTAPAGLREGVEGTLVMCSMQEPIVSALLPWILTGWDT